MKLGLPYVVGLILFLAMGLAGCTPTIRGVPLLTPLAPAPKLAKDDPIQTYAQYKEAVKAAEEKVPASVKETIGSGRLVAYTQEIAKLPSAQSGEFAQALASTLRWHGIKVPELEGRERRNEMTYDELAMMQALTEVMVRGPEVKGEVPAAMRVPEETMNAFWITIAEHSPCDAAALVAARGSFSPPADMVRRSNWLELFIWESGELRRLQGALFNRYMWSFRPLNLTSLAIFDGGGIDDEWLAYYIAYLGWGYYDAPLGILVQHEIVDGMVDAAQRAKALDASAETQKMLDKTIQKRGDP